MLLVQSAWRTRRSSPAPSQLQAGLGLPPGKRLPWQPRPKPRLPGPKACPPPAVPWLSPPTPAVLPSTPALPVPHAPQTRRAKESALVRGLRVPKRQLLRNSAQLRMGTGAQATPPVQVVRCAPHSCRHPHLVPTIGLARSRRVPPGHPRPLCGCPSSASCSLVPKKAPKSRAPDQDPSAGTFFL